MFIKTSVPGASGFHANILQRHTAYYKDSKIMSDEHGLQTVYMTLYLSLSHRTQG